MTGVWPSAAANSNQDCAAGLSRRGVKGQAKNKTTDATFAGRAGTAFQRLSHTRGCNSFSRARTRLKMPAAIRQKQSQVCLAVGCFFADGCLASDNLSANSR